MAFIYQLNSRGGHLSFDFDIIYYIPYYSYPLFKGLKATDQYATMLQVQDGLAYFLFCHDVFRVCYN